MPRKRNKKYVSESYLIKQYYINFCKQVTHIFRDLGAWRAGDPRKVRSHLDSELKGKVHLNEEKNGSKRNMVTLSNFHYSGDSKIQYGKKKIVSEKAVDSGKSVTFDYADYSEETGEVNYVHSYKVKESETHELNQEYRTEITSETTLSGSYGGASVEQKFTATFGTSIQVNTSGTSDKETEHTITWPIKIKPGKKVMAKIQKTELVTETPFDINGYLDHKIHLDWEDWSYKRNGWSQSGLLWQRRGRSEVSFESIEDFLRFLNGYDLRFPRMRQYASRCSKKASRAWDWFEDKRNRKIVLSGIKKRDL